MTALMIEHLAAKRELHAWQAGRDELEALLPFEQGTSFGVPGFRGCFWPKACRVASSPAGHCASVADSSNPAMSRHIDCVAVLGLSSDLVQCLFV